MGKEIELLKNNEDRNWDDLEWIEEFYKWLQGEKAETTVSGFKPKLTAKKAFNIIWYLQEVLSILPSNIEKCDICDELYDGDSEGIYWETKGKFYCSGCDHLVPEKYDMGK